MATRITPPAGADIRTDLGTPHTVAFMVAHSAVRAQVKRLVAHITTMVELEGEWTFTNGFNWRAQQSTVTAVAWMLANKKVFVSGGPAWRPTLRAL